MKITKKWVAYKKYKPETVIRQSDNYGRIDYWARRDGLVVRSASAWRSGKE